MIMVKILERKGIIRLFGMALFLSPIFNTFASLMMRPHSADRWNFPIFWKVLSSGNFADHALYFASVSIGLIMLTGLSSVWKFVLILLGGHIARQVFQLGENIRTHWIYGFFFLINVAVFLFIADQLVWKQKAKSSVLRQPQPQPSSENNSPVQAPAMTKATTAPPAQRSPARKKILVHFDGLGPWAQLMSVSNRGILVRSIAKPPEQIDSREIEISMKNGLRLRTRLARQTEQEYFFEYIHLSSNEIRLLNQWLQQQAA